MIELNGKRIMIIGAALSGTAAADLLTKSAEGADIILYDANAKGTLDASDIRGRLDPAFKGRVVLGEIPADCREGLDVLVLSPGVPIDLPFVLEQKAKGVKVIGEVELAYYYSKGKVIAVTGTNGKTTTTALTGHIMSRCFKNTIVVGNIGTPYTTLVTQTDDDSMTVAEMSSFQLDTTETFRPDVSMILNITPDHLDRHHTMENYISAKFAISRNQTEHDICILNYEDETLRAYADRPGGRVVWFSSVRELSDGYFYKDGGIYGAVAGQSRRILDTDRMQLIGVHNYENVMAAVAAAVHMGISDDDIREAVYSFKPVAHRIEYVATKNGVRYYNDSKGTNPDASIKAVQAMTTPTLLIGGGYDKHSEYDEWIESFEGKIRYLILMGQTRDKIAECARRHGFEDIVFVESMQEAVEFCSAHARPGETVLLSPCCASWGMFKNYEERGDIFKELVNSLE